MSFKMPKSEPQDQFERLVTTYLNVDAVQLDSLRAYIRHRATHAIVMEFRKGLADSILEGKLKKGRYEDLTDEDFDTEQEFAFWLRQVWKAVFGDEPVSAA